MEYLESQIPMLSLPNRGFQPKIVNPPSVLKFTTPVRKIQAAPPVTKPESISTKKLPENFKNLTNPLPGMKLLSLGTPSVTGHKMTSSYPARNYQPYHANSIILTEKRNPSIAPLLLSLHHQPSPNQSQTFAAMPSLKPRPTQNLDPESQELKIYKEALQRPSKTNISFDFGSLDLKHINSEDLHTALKPAENRYLHVGPIY